MKSRRPNIVIMNSDQMRADSMFHLGNPAAVTPVLDELAAAGISFANAYCQNPVCTPSRCSFMSGWYPHVAGHRTMEHMMHDHEPVLLRELKENGYHVWMNQRNDLLPAQFPENYKKYCSTYYTFPNPPEPLPNDNWRGEKEGDNYYSFFRGIIPAVTDSDELWVQGAVDFILNYDGEEPFCLFLPLMNPHPPYQVEKKYYDRIDKNKLPPRILPPAGFQGKSRMNKELNHRQNLHSWDEERYNELRAVYLGMCSKVDDYLGRILTALREKNLYDDTALFFFSDHGDYTGDFNLVEKVQNSFEDCLTNVPFVMKLPAGMQKRRGVSNEMVELIDFYATVREIAQLPDTHRHFGRSLVPFAGLAEEELREAVFCEGGFAEGEIYCSETGGKLGIVPENLYYPRLSLQTSPENYNGKAIMCRTRKFKYIKRLYEQDELYDLEKDSQEVYNRIDSEEYKEVLAEMKEILLNHYLATCDVVPYEKDQRMDANMKLSH